MNKHYESIDEYLDEVSMYLEPLPDRDQIINELRAHLWDLANKISREKEGLTVQEAFNQAISLMEDPQTLANKFLEEEPSDLKTDWKAPIRTPEAKVTNEQFIFIAIIGLAAVLVLSIIIQIVSNDLLVSLISMAIGLLAIGMFTLSLYLSDEKLFREQLNHFRTMFQKPSIDREITKEYDKGTVFVQAETKYKEVSFWSAFGEHFGGFLGGVFFGLLMAFLFFIDVTQAIPLFNENWYYIGAIVTYIALGTGLLKSIWLVAFGKIRYTRLVSAIANIVGGICALILVIYYPFTIEKVILTFASNAQNIEFLPYVDQIIRLIIGISGIIQLISALYDVFKFGAWQPSDRKSLI